MIKCLHILRPILVALAWLVLTAPLTLAHSGEDHGGGNTETWWLGAAGVVVLVTLVYKLARRDGAGVDEPAGDIEP